MSKQQERQRQFFELIFADKPNNEYITIVPAYRDKEGNAIFTKELEKHFKSIDDALKYTNKVKYNTDVYFSLAATDGTGRTTDNLLNRYVIALDFDKKSYDDDFNFKDIIQRIQMCGHQLYYHFMVDSGNGYHVYFLLEPTNDIEKVVKVTKAITNLLNADLGACSPAQILRVPYTFNRKQLPAKPVNTIWINEKIKRYDIDRLYNEFCANSKQENTVTKYLPTGRIPPCIQTILRGVSEGERDFFLARLISYFKGNNYSKEKTMVLIKEWNTKNEPPMADLQLNYQFNYMWEREYTFFGCSCNDEGTQELINKHCDKLNCNKVDQYERIESEEDEVVYYESKILNSIKYSGGKKPMLNGNHITILGLLKVFGELDTKELEKQLTSTITKKECLSKPTRIKTLKELEELGFIEVTPAKGKIPAKYKMKNIKCLESEKMQINYFALKYFIAGAINPNAFRTYCYILWLKKQGQSCTQENIANDLNLKQSTIAEQVKELEEAGYLIVRKMYNVNPNGVNFYYDGISYRIME